VKRVLMAVIHQDNEVGQVGPGFGAVAVGNLPVRRVGPGAPQIDVSAEFIDDGGGVVLLFFGGEAFAFIEDE